jgi:hypothetical protein
MAYFLHIRFDRYRDYLINLSFTSSHLVLFLCDQAVRMDTLLLCVVWSLQYWHSAVLPQREIDVLLRDYHMATKVDDLCSVAACLFGRV